MYNEIFIHLKTKRNCKNGNAKLDKLNLISVQMNKDDERLSEEKKFKLKN